MSDLCLFLAPAQAQWGSDSNLLLTMIRELLLQLGQSDPAEQTRESGTQSEVLMAKKTVAADKKASSKPKSDKKAKQALAIEAAVRVNDDLIRERAYGIWIAEGRPHGREVAHWQRARHELLAAQ
jgi:hypothetical protein